MNTTYTGRYNEISRKILKELIFNSESKNIVFSPLSIVSLLAVLAHVTKEETREEILTVLSEDMNFEDVIQIISQFLRTNKDEKSLRCANAVLVNENIRDTIVQGLRYELEKLFNGELIISDEIASDVNDWISKNTEGRISEFADSSMNDMLAGIINTVVFQAEWEKKYYDEDCEKGIFYNSDGTTSKVDYLYSSEWGYIENDFFTGAVKPYKTDYSYVVLLPKVKNSKVFLYKSLSELDISSLFTDCQRTEVCLCMPEFEFEFKKNITEICNALGIVRAFSSQADYSGLSSEWLKMDQIIHAANIKVDRKGTCASALTWGVVIAGVPDFDEIKIVTLDRPFLYAIVHDETKLPVFMGMVNQL